MNPASKIISNCTKNIGFTAVRVGVVAGHDVMLTTFVEWLSLCQVRSRNELKNERRARKGRGGANAKKTPSAERARISQNSKCFLEKRSAYKSSLVVRSVSTPFFSVLLKSYNPSTYFEQL